MAVVKPVIRAENSSAKVAYLSRPLQTGEAINDNSFFLSESYY